MLKYLLIGFLLSGQVMAEEINVKVQGMVCSMCAQGIQKKFKSQDGIQSLDVNLDTKVVKIITKDSGKISDDVIEKLIKEAGYNVSEIQRK